MTGDDRRPVGPDERTQGMTLFRDSTFTVRPSRRDLLAGSGTLAAAAALGLSPAALRAALAAEMADWTSAPNVEAAKAQGDRRTPASTSSELATRFLVDRGRLAPGEGMLVGLLRTLRDRAARLDQAPPSADDARRFVDLALRLASRIDEVA